MASNHLTKSAFQLNALEPFGALLWQAPALAVGRSHACATACTTTVADGAGPSPDAWCPPRNDQKRLCPDMASHVQLQLLQLQSTPRRLQSWIPTGDHNAHGRAHPHVLPRTFAGPDAARPPLGLTPKLAPPHCHHLAEHGHQQFAHHLTHIAAGELRDGQVPDCHPAPGSASHIAVGHAVLDLGAQPQHRQQQQQHHDHQQLGSSALSAPSAPWFCGQGHHASAPGGGLGLAAHPTRQTDVWTALRTGWTVSRRHELPGAPSGSEQRGTMQSATGPGPSGSGAGAGTDTPGTGPVSGGSATEVGSSTGTGTDAGSGSGAGGSGSDDEAEPPPVPLDPDVKPPGLLFVTGGAAASALLAVTVAALGILGTFYAGWAISSMAKELRRQQHGEEGRQQEQQQQQQQRKEQPQEQAKQAATATAATEGQRKEQQQQSTGPVAQQEAGPQQAGGTGGTARGGPGWSWWVGRGWLWGRGPRTQQPRAADGSVGEGAGEGAAGPAGSG